MSTHFPLAASRREFLFRSGGGLGGIALNYLLARDARADSPKPGANPLAAKAPHFEPKAKRVIFLFMVGGPSQVDLFDPKPALAKWAGKPLPESTGRPKSQFTSGAEVILPSTRKFRKHGQSGAEISDLLPHLATCADDICFLRSCWCSNTVHAPAMYELHSGRTLMGWPSLGSWVTYGLGSASENLPAYCVMPQPEGVPEGGAPCWSSAFLPPVYQGTLLRRGPSPIINLKPPADTSEEQNKRQFELVQKLNAAQSGADAELNARTASYELAFKMFGRTPVVEMPGAGDNAGRINGRDHNHYGFTVWLAGGGAKGGTVVGATDEFGLKTVEDHVGVNDFHATILHLLGLDHEKLTYRHSGRDERLTDVGGVVVEKALE